RHCRLTALAILTYLPLAQEAATPKLLPSLRGFVWPEHIRRNVPLQGPLDNRKEERCFSYENST
ncbi:MAG: hypothetical protein V3T92_07925, partial [Anaerolineae bacterium]